MSALLAYSDALRAQRRPDDEADADDAPVRRRIGVLPGNGAVLNGGFGLGRAEQGGEQDYGGQKPRHGAGGATAVLNVMSSPTRRPRAFVATSRAWYVVSGASSLIIAVTAFCVRSAARVICGVFWP